MVSFAESSPSMPIHVVVMGVSGTGKSTIGRAVAEAGGWPFLEGDDYHPESNVAKMAEGIPLTDEDRLPWLRRLAEWVQEQDAAGQPSVMACSALRRSYRDLLREGAARLFFVHLVGTAPLLLERMQSREDHFMPAELLESQLETLEPLDDDEHGLVIDVSNLPGQIRKMVMEHLDRRIFGDQDSPGT